MCARKCLVFPAERGTDHYGCLRPLATTSRNSSADTGLHQLTERPEKPSTTALFFRLTALDATGPHGMQEIREFDSPRLHQKLQVRGGAGDRAGS
jgi:hypothetical protein